MEQPSDIEQLQYCLSRIGIQNPEENPHETAAALKKVIKQFPDCEIALEMLGITYFQLDEYAQSANCYTKLIKLSPKNPAWYIGRGQIYGQMCRTKSEIRDYTAAIRLDPENAYANYRLGIAFYYTNEPVKASEHFERARELEPEAAEAWIYLIKTYSDMGGFEKAISLADEGIALFQDAEVIRWFYREKLNACDENNKFEECYRILAELEFISDPDDEAANADIYRIAGRCCCHTMRDDEAAEWYRKALAANSEDGEIWSKYAFFCRYAKKDLLAAAEGYRKAIKYQGDFWTDYINLGNVYLELGEKEKAKENFQIARDMIIDALKSSRRPCAYYALSECYFGLGDLENAEKYAQLARKLAADYISCNTKDCYEATFVLAKIRKAQGKADEARQYYRKTVAVSQDREYAEARNEFEGWIQ